MIIVQTLQREIEKNDFRGKLQTALYDNGVNGTWAHLDTLVEQEHLGDKLANALTSDPNIKGLAAVTSTNRVTRKNKNLSISNCCLSAARTKQTVRLA